ncbi:hypothetical protein N8485_01200 [Akkermansiaceae bacterium]|nr:hypothetical protein [Akkermansiaceae bacterium]
MIRESPIRVGINGFGRIGRAVLRISEDNPLIEVVGINDIDPMIENHAYLLKYDSTYGRFNGHVEKCDASSLKVNDRGVRFFNEEKIDDVPWEDLACDVIIDASGVAENLVSSKNLVDANRVKKIVVTHSPKIGVDSTIIFGVNDHEFDSTRHHIVSSSICDANACAPVLAALERKFGIASGFITTLHPWLSYQNLVDGSVRSVSNPGHLWPDMSLGRASTTSLIPKNTSLGCALERVLPEVAPRLQSISFRIPTGIVSAADLTLTLNQEVTVEDVHGLYKECEKNYPNVVTLSTDELVSVDFSGERHSVNIDSRWTRVNRGVELKTIIWYDNEWAYSCRVVDTALLVTK